MAGATGAVAASAARACRLAWLLELFSRLCVFTIEVGGLLKKGGLSGTGFQETALSPVQERRPRDIGPMRPIGPILPALDNPEAPP